MKKALPKVKVCTNEYQIHPTIGVWLGLDEYVATQDPYTLSATDIIKPIKQLVLSKRAEKLGKDTEDLSDRMDSALGTAIHDKIREVWLNPQKLMHGLQATGMKPRKAARHAVNPHPKWVEENPDAVLVWVEDRVEKKIGKYTITGEPDIIYDYQVFDHKKCHPFLWRKEDGMDKFLMQGSVYRWLVPERITNPLMGVNHVFTQWSKRDFNQVEEGAYPPAKVMTKFGELASLEDTQDFIESQLEDYEKFKDARQQDIPRCTPEDLWMDSSTWKYYSNPDKLEGRATKNFDNESDAIERQQQDIKKWSEQKKPRPDGVIIEVKGSPTACEYCAAKEICAQREEYVEAGLL